MKRLLFILTLAVIAIGAMAENYPTKFLGIPIDGTKEDMIRKIQEKGYTYDQEHDCLRGQFNGSDVRVYIATNGNKVWRIMVSEATTFPEREIRIRFNNLLHQFRKNKKYIPLNDNEYRIPENEQISYEMIANKKRYSAEFLQITHDIDTALVYAAIIEGIKTTGEQMGLNFSLDSLAESTRHEFLSNTFEMSCLDAYEKNRVWFMICQFMREYYLTIFYDNGYNQADGEDL